MLVTAKLLKSSGVFSVHVLFEQFNQTIMSFPADDQN